MNDIKTFKALLIEETPEGKFTKTVKELDFSFLKENDVLIKVQYSSLNYKDALSASGNKGITRQYPHIPGIDIAGTVVKSSDDRFSAGEEVIVTGYDLGMNTFGGFAEYAYVPANWVVKNPANLTLKEAMTLGTSAFTASIGVSEIVNKGITPADGKVLVTGATGAVGSSAVQILNKLGFEVIASTRKESEVERLKALGASEIINVNDMEDVPNKGLLSKKWIAAFDTVGGSALSYILKATADGGVVTNCGMIGSVKLDTSIMPFIIRGVRLIGIAAAETKMPLRLQLWDKLANEFKVNITSDYYDEITLDEVPAAIDNMLAGKLKKKVLVKIR